MDEDVQRRAWFEQYTARVERGTLRPPITGVRYSCPCCGYPTLSERGGYDICQLCRWEDDGQDDAHADEVWGGPNGSYSLTRARQNFLRHLIMYDPAEPRRRIGGADSERQLEAKRAMIEAFNSMASAPDEDALQTLWQAVSRAEAVLGSETARKIAEYEAMHSRSESG
jgi:hypothetical protein